VGALQTALATEFGVSGFTQTVALPSLAAYLGEKPSGRAFGQSLLR
jgi:hypothetical protein